MGKNSETSAVIDGLLRFMLLGGVVSVGLAAPNALEMLDKPLQKTLKKLDERERRRHVQKLVSYMKTQGLATGSYEHGLTITPDGIARARRADYDNLSIAPPSRWDGRWRLVFFDIPETKHSERTYLTNKLRDIGFQLLQQSIWIHPFSCREVIQAVAVQLDITQHITYIETNHIDHESKLVERFVGILSNIPSGRKIY